MSLLGNWFELHKDDPGNRTIVKDCGGNKGHVSINLAKMFPDLSFIVQDKYDEFLDERKPPLSPELSPD
jgi:hypothetical protein